MRPLLTFGRRFPGSAPHAFRASATAAALGATLAFVLGASGARAAGPDVATLIDRYLKAVSDPGTPEFAHTETIGTLEGAGLSGSFHSWVAGERERTDQNLGPRSERTLRIGNRIWYADADGDVREFTSVLARRARTARLIDSGDFAKEPERCVTRGSTTIGGRTAYALDVTADGGETETLYLDAVSGLPVRIAYDDDDGRTTIDLADWRDVGGHRFPFRGVASNGDHAYDTTQRTLRVDLTTPIDPGVFAPLQSRAIDMAAPETLPLESHEGHLYAPVTIGGHRFTFLLDTGAQNILIDRHVAVLLGLATTGALEASGTSRTGGLQLANIAEIDVGTGRLHDIVATTIDLGASTAGAFRIDGILGYPFFSAATVRIDADAKTMEFGPPGTIAPAGERLALDLDRAFPEAHLRLNASTSAPFIIDTGNAAELLLYKPFVDRHPGIVPFSLTSRHSYGIGGATSSYRSTLGEIDFGSVPVYHAETDVMQATHGAFADRVDAGNVGLGLLKKFAVTFDLANAAMYIERGAAFDDGRTRT